MRALEALRPDVVLIEGPPDADGLIPLAAHAQMAPPVALLVYNPKALAQAAFYPFAEFSPEWQAMLYALREKIPVRFMDLPLRLAFAGRPAEETPPADDSFAGLSDPFSELARLAGYSDPERWWEATFERRQATVEAEHGIFEEITSLMHTLRAAKTGPETPETLLREAHMRQAMRAAEKEGGRRIAVVCGAWHAPALADTPRIKAGADAALLKGLPRVKTEATWIPWSFDRLATRSGYGAGVLAPHWYRLLFGQHASPVARWMAEAARLLRARDLVASSAHVIEAIRLAEALAALRQTALPGIEELREAAVAALCEGEEKPLDLIDRELVIGEAIGQVPDAVPVPPLKADFEAEAKSCRLERSPAEKTLALDLREEAHLRKSKLLHRLDLMGIQWGKNLDVRETKQGSFHEHWMLQWEPEFEIRLLEAGAWGNTVEEAATRKTLRRAEDTDSLAALTTWLGAALKADLPAALAPVLQKLRHQAALARDALALAEAVPPLVEALRYGHARRLYAPDIQQLLDALVPRFCLQLPAACAGIDDALAAEILPRILAFHRAVDLLRQNDFSDRWQLALRQTGQSGRTAPLLAGLCLRLLFDRKLLASGEAAEALHFRLSAGQAPADAARWLEGFLQGSGLLLVHHEALRGLLDAWLGELPEETFRETLPLLRRTFSRFAGPEREKLLEIAKTGPTAPDRSTVAETGWDEARAAAVLPLLRRIL